jgi:hypothetical protein
MGYRDRVVEWNSALQKLVRVALVGGVAAMLVAQVTGINLVPPVFASATGDCKAACQHAFLDCVDTANAEQKADVAECASQQATCKAVCDPGAAGGVCRTACNAAFASCRSDAVAENAVTRDECRETLDDCVAGCP